MWRMHEIIEGMVLSTKSLWKT